MTHLIELQKVFFQYKGNHALQNINLKIQEGDSIALIGPNGSGKSTLLKIINGIVFPDKGQVVFDGQEINAKTLSNTNFSKQFHKRVGFVFQNSDAQLFCPNVYEEIAFGPRQMQMEENEVNNRVSDCLKMLLIEHLKHREPYHLSEGEKRKVALAAVLSLNPEVLTLDEPMDGLDPRTKRFLKELLTQINKAGKTIICATHDFEYIQGLFKKVIVISEDHTVIREGNLEEIISDEPFLLKHNLK
jgi:cobalt/nickel transport system ATP-binding protein